jgi:hypothetical protein
MVLFLMVYSVVDLFVSGMTQKINFMGMNALTVAFPIHGYSVLLSLVLCLCRLSCLA